MCGGGNKKGTATQAPTATPPVPEIVQAAIRALEVGPTGYNEAMRENIGADIQMGGARPVSGMTRTAPSFTGYQPVAATPDPLKEILDRAPPAAPTPAPAPAPAPKPTPAPTPAPGRINPINRRPRSWDD